MFLSRAFRIHRPQLTLQEVDRLIVHPFVNLKRQSSSKFVDRMRLQQKLKAGDQLSMNQYSNGQYLIYIREGGLVLISKDNKNLVHADFKGIKNWSVVAIILILAKYKS